MGDCGDDDFSNTSTFFKESDLIKDVLISILLWKQFNQPMRIISPLESPNLLWKLLKLFRKILRSGGQDYRMLRMYPVK